MKYKLSVFNHIVMEGKNCIIYNSFSGGILGLNEYFSNEYKKIEQNEKIEEIDKGLVENMLLAQMLVESDLDEANKLETMSSLCRFDNTCLTLTIAPTMECNFACTYCYEAGRRYNTMNLETIEILEDFIETNIEGKKHLSIAWYGGEPLLAIDIIEKISERILKLNIDYHAHIVTNGYLLNKEMANRLIKCGIEHVQVTVDGPETTHNEKRMLKNGENTFGRILQNISDVCEQISIKVRVNVDRENILYIDGLLDALDKYNLKGKISLYLAPIHNLNHSCNASTCFTQPEFAKEQIDFYRRNIRRGYFFANIPQCLPGICGAVKPNAYVIDPLGDLYKCWDDIGNKKEIIGNISNSKNNNLFSANSVKWLSYSPFRLDECKRCSIMPICMGGCPNVQIKGFEPRCHPSKYFVNEFVLLKKELEE